MQLPVTLEIVLGADGKLNVNGPLGDKVLCYGMLGLAKDVVRTYDASAASPIVRPPAGVFRPKVVGS